MPFPPSPGLNQISLRALIDLTFIVKQVAKRQGARGKSIFTQFRSAFVMARRAGIYLLLSPRAAVNNKVKS